MSAPWARRPSAWKRFTWQASFGGHGTVDAHVDELAVVHTGV
ncbi:MAG: hypothetical protein JWO67_4877 [Streptosporangiaceae bacterium]|nr:hypothetical protein [Streptosporangiaceae bacterium]